MHKRFIVTFVICINCLAYGYSQSGTPSQTSEKKGIWHRGKRDAACTGQTILKTYARPFKWQKKEWLKFGGVIAISGIATFLDEPIDDLFIRNQTKPFDRIADVGDFLGQPENNYPFMLAVWSSGVIVNNDWLRDTGIMLFASVTTSGLIQTALKDIVGRARPGIEKGPYQFKPFSNAGYHSFPSGHTMLALASSWILAKQSNWLPLKILFYSVPVVVGVSRMYDRAHWFSDILLGSALGIACAETVHKLYPKLRKKKSTSGLSILPSINSVRLVYLF